MSPKAIAETWWYKIRHDEDFKDIDNEKAWRLLVLAVAEMLGTCILVFMGCSVIATCVDPNQSTLLNISLAFTLAVTIVVTAFAHISGAHFNPAVSLSALIFGELSALKLVLYVISQCVGAVLGIVLIKVITPDSCTDLTFCVTLPSDTIGPVKAMIAEIILTGILILVINSVWDPRAQDDSVAVKVGLTVGGLVLAGAQFSGASLNPARSFGPALIAKNFNHHWVYWVGPIGGSLLATTIYRVFFSEVKPKRSQFNNAKEETSSSTS